MIVVVFQTSMTPITLTTPMIITIFKMTVSTNFHGIGDCNDWENDDHAIVGIPLISGWRFDY